MDALEQWMNQLFDEDEWMGKMTEKQRKIVNAAIEVFSEKGYASTSTSEIAKKAGVAEGTIFRHYKTKKELLLAIIAPVMAKFSGPLLLKDFAETLDRPYDTYEDFLRAVFRNRYEFAKSHLPIVKIIVQEVPFHDELKEQFKNLVSEMVIARMHRIIDNYKDRGVLTDRLPTPSMIRFVVSTMVGLVATLLILIPEKQLDENEELERTIDMIMHGIAAKPQ